MRDRKVLLVTGASSDVGSKLIRRIAGNYEIILAHYCHDKDRLEAMRAELGDKLILLRADFTDLQSVAAMVDRIDALGCVPDHIVHLPAQRVRPERFHKTAVEQYTDGFTTAVASIVVILKHFLPKMSKHKYGKVVFMLTSFTLNAPPKYQAPYITAKYALLGLMRDLAREYADKHIMVNGVSPDMMETKFLADTPELVIQQNAANNPMGRNLVVEDVLPTFEYILSDGADLVTGQNIGVTGGVIR